MEAVFGAVQTFPVRQADLWLFSNVRALRGRPFCLELARGGVAYRNVRFLSDPEKNCPLIGMRAFKASSL